MSRDRQSILRKIERLLAISERATGPEAETALNHARRLMAEYQVAPDDLGAAVEYSDRIVWRGKRMPGWYEPLLTLIYFHFYCKTTFRRVVDEGVINQFPDSWWDRRDKFEHQVILFGDEANLPVGCYAWAVLLRQIKEQIKLHKPQNVASFVDGLVCALAERFRADERGWAARSEETAIKVDPRRAKDELDLAFGREFGQLKAEPLAKHLASLGDCLLGAAVAREVSFHRPLPGEAVPSTLLLNAK